MTNEAAAQGEGNDQLKRIRMVLGIVGNWSEDLWDII